MTTETIQTITVDRTATVSLVRTIDLDKIIREAKGGSVDVEALKAGTYEIVTQPVARGSEETRAQVNSAEVGHAYLLGFEACHALKSKRRADDADGAETKAKSKSTKKKTPTKDANGKAATA